MARPLRPPSIPPGLPYTPYYCEENIYLLAQNFIRNSCDTIARSWELSVVFISNDNGTVALWAQDAASVGPDRPVVWDYHCILVMRPIVALDGESTWVFDYNSRLSIPCQWQEYIQETFKSDLCNLIPEEFRSVFRIVPAVDFIERFASDRSHMMKPRKADGEIEYRHPPPEYEPIVGNVARRMGITNNLMKSFVNMERSPATTSMGHVLPDDEFWSWGSCGDPSQ